MINELDEITALEERWIRHGGPMTFSEYQQWEWDQMEQEAYNEEWRRSQQARANEIGSIVMLRAADMYVPFTTMANVGYSMPYTDYPGPR